MTRRQVNSLPTDRLAEEMGMYVDDTQARQIQTFAKRYCGVDLLRWQYEDVIAPIWSWKRPSGNLRYKTAHIWCPKKQGKSFLLAIIACWKCVSQPSTKTIILSGVKEQCDEIWECIEKFSNQNKTLGQRLWFSRSTATIRDRKNKSSIKVISSNGIGKSSYNSDLVIVDEFFELSPAYARQTWAKIIDSGMARPDSLVLTISHANYNHNCPAFDCWEYSQKLIKGKSDDLTTYALHYGVGEHQDWTDSNLWWSQLPGCPEIVSREFYLDKFNKVKNSPLDSAQFRIFHLNQLTSVPVNWLPHTTIQACYEDFPADILDGGEVIIGIDAAKSKDVMSYCVAGKKDDLWYIIPHFAVPQDNLDQWSKDHHMPYREYATDPRACLRLTPGDCIDHALVCQWIADLTKRYKVKQVRYDPTNFQSSRQWLQQQGLDCVEVKQSLGSMSPCFRHLETLFNTRKLRHNGGPIFLKHLDNCVPHTNKWDQLDLRKVDPNKIDGVDAAAIALSYWIDQDTQNVIPHGQQIARII